MLDRVAIVLFLISIAGCGPAGRPLGSAEAMRARQSLWERCQHSVRREQCGDDPDTVYQTICMRRIGDQYFDTRSLEAARAIIVSYGCSPSIAGTGGPASTSAGSSGFANPRQPWTNAELRDFIVRINDAMVSCFGPEHVPVRTRMTIDARGHVSAHEISSDATDEERGCVARLLVSVDLEATSSRMSRQFEATFGDVALDAAMRARTAAARDHSCDLDHVVVAAEHPSGFWLDVCGTQHFYRPDGDAYVEQEAIPPPPSPPPTAPTAPTAP